MRSVALFALASAAACAGPEPPRAFGEALIIVDTDLSPALVDRLRVDLYSGGAWFDSREIQRTTVDDWPASFGVHSDDDTREKLVWVRLRLHPSAHRRDYRGERFREIGREATPIDAEGRPRLVISGVDVTPDTEPEPLVTIDRLLLVRLRPGVRGAVRVTLRGACAGTMAKLAANAAREVPVFGVAETCFDSEHVRAPVAESPLDPDRQRRDRSLAGTFGVDTCEGLTPPPDVDAACVPGGAFILGSRDFLLELGRPTWPARLARVRSFFIDRRELTVGRYRAALAAGFRPTTPPPTFNDDELSTARDFRDQGYCTYSHAPLPGVLGREEYALSCIGWDAALRFCEHHGGTLPTEAQWEYAAAIAGRPRESLYAWGDQEPTCDRTVYGRIDLVHPSMRGLCSKLPRGPQMASEVEPGDITPLGIIGMAGGMSEWTRDSVDEFDGPCWSTRGVTDPWCDDPRLARRSVRGGGWTTEPKYLYPKRRFASPIESKETMITVRCVYPVEGPR